MATTHAAALSTSGGVMYSTSCVYLYVSSLEHSRQFSVDYLGAELTLIENVREKDMAIWQTVTVLYSVHG
jgi:hypothetical protein